MSNELPSDFDWVTALSQCSVLNMYESLKADAKKNVETMLVLAKARNVEPPSLTFHDNKGSFGVTRWWYGEEMGVRVTLRDDHIDVESLRVDVRFAATLTLNDSGDCRLLVNGEQLDRWQFLRRALEPLLFPTGR